MLARISRLTLTRPALYGEFVMSNTGIDLADYVKVNGMLILVRSVVSRDWNDSAKFTLDEAEDVADYIMEKVDEARRNDPDVQRLTQDIEDSDAFQDASATMEDLALYLYQKGYRKVK
jgi:hypothetical protein